MYILWLYFAHSFIPLFFQRTLWAPNLPPSPSFPSSAEISLSLNALSERNDDDYDPAPGGKKRPSHRICMMRTEQHQMCFARLHQRHKTSHNRLLLSLYLLFGSISLSLSLSLSILLRAFLPTRIYFVLFSALNPASKLLLSKIPFLKFDVTFSGYRAREGRRKKMSIRRADHLLLALMGDFLPRIHIVFYFASELTFSSFFKAVDDVYFLSPRSRSRFLLTVHSIHNSLDEIIIMMFSS